MSRSDSCKTGYIAVLEKSLPLRPQKRGWQHIEEILHFKLEGSIQPGNIKGHDFGKPKKVFLDYTDKLGKESSDMLLD